MEIPYLPPEKPVCRSKSNSENQTWNNRLVPNWEKSTSRLFCHPAYINYMQSTSCVMPHWMKLKLESRLPGEISSKLRYANDITLMAESEEELQSFLMKLKEESEKASLKLSIQRKTQDYGIWSGCFMANKWGNSDRLYFLRLQNHCRQ